MDNTIYANDAYAQSLLETARNTAKVNLVDPVAIDENYLDLEPAILGGGSVLITGPAQNGKSTAVLLLSAKLGIPCITFSCDDGIQRSSVFGSVALGANGESMWEDGPLLKAFRNGYWFNAEEILQLPPERTSMFMKVADESESFTGFRGEVIKRHPNFRFIATGNPMYHGNKKANQAFSRRFAYVLDIGELSKNSFLLIGKSIRPELSPEFYNASFDLAKAVTNECSRLGMEGESCGVTQLKGLLNLITCDSSPLTIDSFFRKTRNTFVNVMIKARLPQNDRDNFFEQKATESIIACMYQAYVKSQKSNASSGKKAEAPSNASADVRADVPQSVPAPKPSSGKSLFDQLEGLGI